MPAARENSVLSDDIKALLDLKRGTLWVSGAHRDSTDQDAWIECTTREEAIARAAAFPDGGYIAPAYFPSAAGLVAGEVGYRALLEAVNEYADAALFPMSTMPVDVFDARPGAPKALRLALTRWARQYLHTSIRYVDWESLERVEPAGPVP